MAAVGRASPHFPAFFGRARTYMSLGIIDEVNHSVVQTAFGLVNVNLKSALFGEINGSQFMLEHLLFFVNQLKSFFPVDGWHRLNTLRSDFVFLI